MEPEKFCFDCTAKFCVIVIVIDIVIVIVTLKLTLKLTECPKEKNNRLKKLVIKEGVKYIFLLPYTPKRHSLPVTLGRREVGLWVKKYISKMAPMKKAYI